MSKPRQPAGATGPSSAYAVSWRRYRRWRGLTILLLVLTASTYLAAIPPWRDQLPPDLAPGLRLVFGLLALVPLWKFCAFRCPRCGERFFSAKKEDKSRCQACGLAKGEEPAAPEPCA